MNKTLMPFAMCIEHLALHLEKMDFGDRRDSLFFMERLAREPLRYPSVIAAIEGMLSVPIKPLRGKETATVYQFAKGKAAKVTA